jgi:hypothetical protein
MVQQHRARLFRKKKHPFAVSASVSFFEVELVAQILFYSGNFAARTPYTSL